MATKDDGKKLRSKLATSFSVIVSCLWYTGRNRQIYTLRVSYPCGMRLKSSMYFQITASLGKKPSHVSRNPLQSIDVTTPGTGHVVEITF